MDILGNRSILGQGYSRKQEYSRARDILGNRSILGPGIFKGTGVF